MMRTMMMTMTMIMMLQTLSVEILSGLALVAPEAVLRALTAAGAASAFPFRFQGLVWRLAAKGGNPKEEARLKTAILAFFNALLQSGAQQVTTASWMGCEDEVTEITADHFSSLAGSRFDVDCNVAFMDSRCPSV